MESAASYIPMDRRLALARGQTLPDRTSGVALFADLVGFTPLTESLVQELGPRRGAEALTNVLNQVYSALITEVHRHGGSVVSFSGDAITCWFDGDDGRRATAAALSIQEVLEHSAESSLGGREPLAIKVALAAGPVRRLVVGSPHIQTIDVLAGTTLERMATAEKRAEPGEILVGAEIASALGSRLQVRAWRESVEPGTRFAVVAGLLEQGEAAPWSAISPTGEERETAELATEQVRPWLLPPVYERLQAGQGQFLAELRPATALFVKFAGLDYDQDDAVGEKLDAFVRWVQGVLARYAGYMLQLTCGDKGSYLYAVFGAPLALADAPDRGVAAALELRTVPLTLGFIRDVRIGISQGRMRVGAYGSPTRRTYGVLGDEVNVAARLMGLAEAGQVLVSQRVAEAAAKSQRFEFLRQVKLKGKQSFMSIYMPSDRNLGAYYVPAGMFLHPLVGREEELARIEQLQEAVLAGEGRILCLLGEAGIGKSHLAAQFVERARHQGLRPAWGTCQSTNQEGAYAPWRGVFRALFDLPAEPAQGEDRASFAARQIKHVKSTLEQADTRWLLRFPLLGDLLDLPIPDNETTVTFEPQLRQESLFALAVEIIQSWALAQPLLLLIEDAQWMDEASLGLTAALGRALGRAAVLLFLIHRPPVHPERPLRPELDHLSHYHLIELGELSSRSIATLVADRLGGAPSALVLSLIETMAQGNPFFTEELVNALRESGQLCQDHSGRWILSEQIYTALRLANCLTQEEGHLVLNRGTQISAADLGIPDSIHGLVLSRIDRLPEAHKLTLKVAGVIGRSFELDLLAGAHPAKPTRETLLAQMELLQERDFARMERLELQQAYTFKHNITQEVVYQTLLEDQQRELHQVVGETLEQLWPESVERLAYHYCRSPLREKALLYLDRAAHKAQREYANETALNYYNQALALEENWRWLQGKAEVLHTLGRRDQERAALDALRPSPGAPLFQVAYLWGRYYEAIGTYTQAQASIEQALAASRQEADLPSEIRCLHQLGAIAGRQGDYDQARAWYVQGLELLEAVEAGTTQEEWMLSRLQNSLGITHAQQGDFAAAKACWEKALRTSLQNHSRFDEAMAHNNLGGLAFYQRRFSEAIAHHRQALEIRRAIGDRAGEGSSLINLAQAVRDAGDYGQTLDLLAEALAIQQAIGNLWDEANVWNELGGLYLLLGDLSQAESCLQQGLGVSRRIHDEAGQAYILCNLGQVAYHEGDLDRAQQRLAEGLALARKQADRYLESLILSHLAATNLQGKKVEQAIEQAEQALQTRQELDLHLWTTADLATLAQAYIASGDMAKALDYASRALAILDGCAGEGPEFPQRDYFACYQVFAAAGEEAAAQGALQSAHELVMAQAQKISDPALRRAFLEGVHFNREIVQKTRNT